MGWPLVSTKAVSKVIQEIDSYLADVTTTEPLDLDQDLLSRLRNLGKAGESENQILRRLLESAEYLEFMEENYRLLKEETDWTPLDEV